MFAVLANRTYRNLFLAQLIALIGTGLATVALGLLAFSIADENAGAVLGTALAIKMIANVTIAPIAAAITERLPRKQVLIGLDLIRASVAVFLPFVSEVWHVYVLIVLLQVASASFTPTFQATIPDVLPDERDYTRALSLSRLAYDLENLLSPAIAAVLLLFISFHTLFAGTVIGFIASALLITTVFLPSPRKTTPAGLYDRTLAGVRIYLATPRLRGLLAICMAVAAGGSMVIVNTVVLVQAGLGLEQQHTAMALAAFGCGSMLAALALPRLLDSLPDRPVMLAGGVILVACLLLGPLATNSFPSLLALWFAIGFGYTTAQTPSGRLLRRSAGAEDRPTLFAAQFALSHLCWLFAYPLTGLLGAAFGLPVTFFVMATLAALSLVVAVIVWPSSDPDVLPHTHDDLPADHPHLAEAGHGKDRAHSHAYMIDPLHPAWPR